MQACFIGHRKIQKKEELASSIKQTVLTLIQKGITTFLFGSKSEFDDLAWQVVSDLKITYPFIKRIYVRSAYPYLNKAYEQYLLKNYEETYFPHTLNNAGKFSYVKRNYEMIDNSTYCLVYYDENYIPSFSQGAKHNSGTKIAYDYAVKRKKNVINLYALP